MKYFISIGILLVVWSYSAFAEVYKEEFISPDNSCWILYEGASDHGDGTFYDISNAQKKLVLKEYFRVGPIIDWVSNKVAELRFSSGSPNYSSYFYDCESKKLSPEYMLPIASDTSNGVVATLDFETIIFYKLFSKSIIYKMHVPNLEPMEFLVFCEPKAQFEPNGTFILEYNCPHQPIKKITINKEVISGQR